MSADKFVCADCEAEEYTVKKVAGETVCLSCAVKRLELENKQQREEIARLRDGLRTQAFSAEELRQYAIGLAKMLVE